MNAYEDEWTRQIRESFSNVTEAESDAIWDKMVADGIIDNDGNVLKRIPEPPDWLTGRNGHTSTTDYRYTRQKDEKAA